MEETMLYERIIEIINLSNNRVNNANNEFIKINGFNIHKDYEEEFRSLLETEKVSFFEEQIREKKFIPTKFLELTQLCKSKLDEEDYKRLYEILESITHLNNTEILEINGYFIPRENKDEFDSLCRKLKVGPHIPCYQVGEEGVKQSVYSKLEEGKAQNSRIKAYLLAKKSNDNIAPVNNTIEDEIEPSLVNSELNANNKNKDYNEIMRIYFEMFRHSYDIEPAQVNIFVNRLSQKYAFDECWEIVNFLEEFGFINYKANEPSLKRQR